MLEFNIEDFHPAGSLGIYMEKPDSKEETKMMLVTPLGETYNLRRYIQHEMAQSDYVYDEDEFGHPLSEPNWKSQTRGKYMFSRSLYITAKSHECDQVLDPDYIPKESEKAIQC